MLDSLWTDLSDRKDPLFSIRKASWERFQATGLPRPKQEAFQYLVCPSHFPQLAKRKEKTKQAAAGLCFVDGFFEETLSQISAPLICLPLERAILSYGIFLQSRIARLLKEESDPFAFLNSAFQGRGAFLYVPPRCKAALHVRQLFQEGLASSRLHVYVGRGASLRLEQETEGKSDFSNQLFDFVLDEGADLTLIDRQVGDFQAIRATLKRDSKVKIVLLSKVVRTSIQVQLAEENSEAQLFGLAQLEGKEQSHVHALIEHAAPHTRSRQHVKSVVNGQSRFSFEGKIWVRPIAQKTEAYQLNNNLILSDEASANAKPNLEILADDVKASHGATVGQLDEEQLFYLRSRGLSLPEARRWLIEGFCQEIWEHAR